MMVKIKNKAEKPPLRPSCHTCCTQSPRTRLSAEKIEQMSDRLLIFARDAIATSLSICKNAVECIWHSACIALSSQIVSLMMNTSMSSSFLTLDNPGAGAHIHKRPQRLAKIVKPLGAVGGIFRTPRAPLPLFKWALISLDRSGRSANLIGDDSTVCLGRCCRDVVDRVRTCRFWTS